MSAFLLPVTPSLMREFKGAAEAERFIVEVMALTGWSEGAARRLDRRLARLASTGLTSLREYRANWRERYCCGWAYSGPRVGEVRWKGLDE